ncbi:hypothetical protein AR437_05085 [Christensenella hongkongensis]|nr:hypothetical protein AR437_05085 [Christensenella hongkongensis]
MTNEKRSVMIKSQSGKNIIVLQSKKHLKFLQSKATKKEYFFAHGKKHKKNAQTGAVGVIIKRTKKYKFSIMDRFL